MTHNSISRGDGAIPLKAFDPAYLILMDRYPTHQTDADFGDKHATPIEQQEMVKRKTRRKQTEH